MTPPRLRDRTRRAQAAWCVYDWANSAFPTVIVTFVFSAYFARGVAESVNVGTAQWGNALAVSGLTIALLSPVLGAIADRAGPRKPWLAALSVTCVTATALLWFTQPDPSWALWGLACFAVANAAFEIGTVFYNSMLPDVAPPERIGRLSGWGWGLGYMGGLTCLTIALFVFVQGDPPPLGLDKEASEHVRVVGPLAATWFALFCLPLFLFVPDRAPTGIPIRRAVGEGLRALATTVRNVRRHRNVAWFLLAQILYVDGMNTMFSFGGIYAAGTFGMAVDEIIMFGIALNVFAGIGAAAFAWLDDIMGPKRVILIALAGLIAFGIPLLLVETQTWFWLVGLPLAIFMGPAQAASRTMMARLAPPELRTEMFGMVALSGRITAFLGPAVLAWATLTFDSQRAGMATILFFLAGGFLVLLRVRAPSPAAP
ncbi:MAG: MFS transporter [Rhodospirillales bacterium]